MSNTTNKSMRVIHRYLGFFLAGIMAIYALSGVILIFRDTDFLKKGFLEQKTIEINVATNQLAEKLRIKGLKVQKEEGGIIYFENGNYDMRSGKAEYISKKLPYFLDQMTHLHKANTSHPLFWLNIFFGSGLLFFVVSTFWMFRPSSSIFKKGLYFNAGGVILTILLLSYG